jgi:hypothetical protein
MDGQMINASLKCAYTNGLRLCSYCTTVLYCIALPLGEVEAGTARARARSATAGKAMTTLLLI